HLRGAERALVEFNRPGSALHDDVRRYAVIPVGNRFDSHGNSPRWMYFFFFSDYTSGQQPTQAHSSREWDYANGVTLNSPAFAKRNVAPTPRALHPTGQGRAAHPGRQRRAFLSTLVDKSRPTPAT